MKPFKTLLFGLCLLAVSCFAQNPQQQNSTGTISATTANCNATLVNTTSCIVLPLAKNTASASIAVSGAYTGTLNFEVTVNGVTSPLSVTPQAGGAAVTSTSSTNTTWQVGVVSSSTVQVRASVLSGGTPSVTIQSSTAPLPSGGSSTIAIPATVSGATSGGIPCFDSATDMNTTVALTANVLPKGGGVGACPSNSSVTDNGTTVSTTETITAPANVAGAYRFSNGNNGWQSFSSGVVCWGAANALCINNNTLNGEITLPNLGIYDWSNNGSAAQTPDTGLSRSAAGVVAVGTGVQGNVTGTIKPGKYATGTNCAATGTAANPSVASCGSSAAGSFSCATNASTGTCTINTTAVTAASEIFVTQRSDTTTGTTLGVTCNATLSTVITEITAVTAATSFTINLGTINTNPECFSYFIMN